MTAISERRARRERRHSQGTAWIPLEPDSISSTSAPAFKAGFLTCPATAATSKTESSLSVGIYNVVEAEFRLEGLPFRLAGVIQAIHDLHHVGIRFLDMSVASGSKSSS